MTSENQAPVSNRFATDRRSAERYPMRLVTRLAHPTGIIYGSLENISESGASFVTTSLEPELETDMEVVLIVTSPPNAVSKEVHCTARIVRVEHFASDIRATFTYAVRFDERLTLEVLGTD